VLVANAHYIAGDILRHEPSRLGEAIVHLEEAARRKPMIAETHRTLAAALSAAGRNDEARRENELAARLERVATPSSSLPQSR
jgi:Flp pilus assembly protein TadD